MKVLLTGSNGFIGSHFIKNYQKKYNIKTFSFRHDNFSQLDLSSTEAIVHLSALVHQMSGASQEEYVKINVTQTIDLANKARENGVKHFIFMSTIKVYGEETDNIYRENSICNPQDEYGKSKLEAEIRLKKFENENFKISIIRTPIVYGCGVKANIKNLIGLIQNVPVLPFGNIQNRRSMVYVGNLCHIIDKIIQQRKSGIFLASDDESFSTTKLVKIIADNLNKKVYLIEIPFFQSLLRLVKPSFHKRLYESLEVDNTITKQKLNLINPYSVEEGIKLMVKGKF